ncbi:hypothetical protein TDB9533_03496 [Thalassocella blandensis]|nr:hypothetical protein TDB9533_03496 [Thalassocella blandensis]
MNTIPYIVSMTTIPNRLSLIRPTIESIRAQSEPPTHIELNIPTVFRRNPAEKYTLPNWLNNDSFVRVYRCQDLGPATKIVPTLIRNNENKINTPVVTVDDDLVYSKNHLRALLHCYINSNRQSLVAGSVACVAAKNGQAPYLKELVSQAQLNQLSEKAPPVFEGFWGVLYPSSFYREKLRYFIESCIQNDNVMCADDLILSVFAWRHNISVILCGELQKIKHLESRCKTDYAHDEYALHTWQTNGHGERYAKYMRQLVDWDGFQLK